MSKERNRISHLCRLKRQLPSLPSRRQRRQPWRTSGAGHGLKSAASPCHADWENLRNDFVVEAVLLRECPQSWIWCNAGLHTFFLWSQAFVCQIAHSFSDDSAVSWFLAHFNMRQKLYSKFPSQPKPAPKAAAKAPVHLWLLITFLKFPEINLLISPDFREEPEVQPKQGTQEFEAMTRCHDKPKHDGIIQLRFALRPSVGTWLTPKLVKPAATPAADASSAPEAGASEKHVDVYWL